MIDIKCNCIGLLYLVVYKLVHVPLSVHLEQVIYYIELDNLILLYNLLLFSFNLMIYCTNSKHYVFIFLVWIRFKVS